MGETDLQRAFGGSCLGRTYTVDFQMPPKIKVLWGEKKSKTLRKLAMWYTFYIPLPKRNFAKLVYSVQPR